MLSSRDLKHEIPDDISEIQLKAPEGELSISQLLKQAYLVSSTSEANRMVEQGAVKIDGEKISDRQLKIKTGKEHIFQVGKR